MKKTLLLLLTLLLFFATTSKAQVQHFAWQGAQRDYLVRTPSEYNETMPVLFFLHGLGDNITRLDNEFHFQQVADDFHWMMVVPQAMQQSGYTMWNAGLTSSNIDDSGFLMALLDSLAEQYPVNLDSVFFTGFSMGGFMTHRMAIEHGDRITACAPVSGLITYSLAAQTAVAPVKMLHIHGTSDPVVGYDGNSQYFGMNLGLGVEAILNYWQDANHCVDEPVVDTFPNLQNDGLLFVRYTYKGDATLQHIKVIGGNHSWYHNENQYDISYLNEIHKFFSKKEGGNVGVDELEQNTIKLWPNPTSGEITIETATEGQLEVMDMLGRIVVKYSVQPGVNHINLGDLPQGMYFVKDETTGAVCKVLIQ
jgi:polyhydroxybutyrate depolymerase